MKTNKEYQILEGYRSEYKKLDEYITNASYKNLDNEKIERYALLKNIISYQGNNVRYAFIQETFANIIDVFNKYTGKAMGEKTKDKIYNELKEMGLSVWWKSTSYSNEIHVIKLNEKGFTVYDRECFEYSMTSNIENPITVDNKIQALSVDNFKAYKNVYIDDVEKQAHLLNSKYKELQEAKKELENKLKEYNNMTTQHMKYIDYNNIR